MSLRVKQSSTQQRGDWWKWSVWLEGTPQDLNAVDHVVYTLHPTFPNPVQLVKNRKNGFRIDSAGWGEFEIYLSIVMKNGDTRRKQHWLKLETAPEAEAQEAPKAAPRAYISNGPADGLLARKLAEALRRLGFRVETSENHAPGVPWEKAVDQMLGSADIVVFFLSGPPSLWTRTEINRALAHKVPHIVPVLVGTSVEVPPPLKDRQVLHTSSPDEIESLAKGLLQAMAREA